MGRDVGKYLIYGLIGVDIALLFFNFIVSFLFSLFLVLVFISSGGYGSPEGKWQAYTTGTGNWRIGGVAARGEDYLQTLDAEMAEKRKMGSGNILPIILGIIIAISLIGLAFDQGSILGIIGKIQI
ncbi:MAG: hypothetical protein GXO25_05345 [Euryarchaeota archaeon]|nr:hypothetical protein [Euryarchaeota archaeon]